MLTQIPDIAATSIPGTNAPGTPAAAAATTLPFTIASYFAGIFDILDFPLSFNRTEMNVGPAQ